MMIAKIDTSFGFDSSINCSRLNYHFEKYLMNKGHILFSDFKCENSKDIHDFFAERVKQYNAGTRKKKVKYSAKNFILSLAKEDNIEPSKFAQIVDSYLAKMGYEHCPRIIFQHNDTDHDHVHVLVSTVSEDLKYIDDSFEKVKSSKARKEIEKEFGLTVLNENRHYSTSFGEAKHREYYFSTALRKALGSGVKSRFYKLKMTPDEVQKIKRSALKNVQLNELLGDRAGDIIAQLNKDNFIKSLFKDELIKRLEEVYAAGSNDGFIQRVKDAGLYARYTKSKMVYGLNIEGDKSIYLNEQALPDKFGYSRIHERVGERHISGEQQEYIFAALCQADQKNILEHLLKYGILVRDERDQYVTDEWKLSGNFGVFRFCDCHSQKPEWIAGAELSQRLGEMDFNTIRESNILEGYSTSPLMALEVDHMLLEALKNGLRSHNTQERLKELLSKDQQFMLKKYSLSNEQVKVMLGTQFEAIDKILYAGGLYNNFYRNRLTAVLDELTDRSDFIAKCIERGIKIRLTKQDKLVYTFTDGGRTYTFHEDRLPINYSFEKLQLEVNFETLKAAVMKPAVMMNVERNNNQRRIGGSGFIPSTKGKDDEEERRRKKGKSGEIGELRGHGEIGDL